MHNILPLFLGLIIAIVLLIMLANKLKVAYPVLLVIGGLLISFIPGMPILHLNPDLIFFIFLPPLLFEAAWSISFKDMRRMYRIITSFAFLVVFFTATTVALIANHYIPGITLALGFLLGGIVSPPDAVSANAILKFVKIPRTTVSLLEGESLLNDASSLLIFRFALIAVGTGQFIWGEAILSFSWMVIGGAGIGLVLGWIFMQAHRKLPTDAESDIIFTLIEPYILYWVAEELHCSGVLAVVFGGLFLANRRMSFLSSTSRLRGFNVWESFVYILNGLVFMIIGLELPAIVQGIRSDGIPMQTAIGYGVLITAVLIVVRIISSYAALGATYIFRRETFRRMRRDGLWKLPLVLGWTGMRGVVSLAAALAIPVYTMGGELFPQRNLIIFITFIVILLTLLIQGLTLPYIIRKTRIFEFDPEPGFSEEEEKMTISRELIEHTLKKVEEKYPEHLDKPIIAKHYNSWKEKLKMPQADFYSAEHKSIYLAILEEQRLFLIEKNKDVNTSDDLIRQQLHMIDLEEEKLNHL